MTDSTTTVVGGHGRQKGSREMALNVRGRKRPNAEQLYEVVASYAADGRAYAAGTRLRGDHPEVPARYGRFMSADLPDDQKGRLRAEADWGVPSFGRWAGASIAQW